jgi:hypothetical protein
MTTTKKPDVSLDQFVYYVERITTLQWDELKLEIPEISNTSATLARDLNLGDSEDWNRDDVAPNKRSTIAINIEHSPIEASFFWDRDPVPATLVDDLLTVISLVKCTLVGTSKAMFHHQKSYSVGYFVGRDEEPPLNGVAGIDTFAGMTLISDAFKIIRSAGADAHVALDLGQALIWHRQAQVARLVSPTVTEVGLYWTTLEVFGRQIIGQKKSERMNARDIVNISLSHAGINHSSIFKLDTLLKETYRVRNKAFHQGISADISDLADIRQKIAVLVSTVMLLQIGVRPDVTKIVQKIEI